ncbi:MAG: PIN domain-containing protein [Anaerolineae bacterium]|nr:PIN domain-containing protein [Anaerolineae bacterium]
MDENVARIAGDYMNQYRKTHKLDLGDAVIAATAKVTDSVLYTRNGRHYPMVDIKVIIPYQRGN